MTVLTITTASPVEAVPPACHRPAGPHGPADARGPVPAPAAQSPTVTDLVRLLFEGDDRRRVHGMWRELIADESFRHREGLSPAEQAALSYERLHAVNRRLEHAEDLATDPRLLAGLHEWAAIVHGGGGLCTLASIHYNLFLGSLLDHEDGPARDLTEFTTLRRTGTFLCTELAHGNDAWALQTTAEFDRSTGGFVLHTPHAGAQKFMPNTSPTGGPKSAVVAARLLVDGEDQGVFLFLTPLSDAQGTLPGIRVRRLPYRAGAPVDHCLTAFDHVPLPRSALLEAEHGRLTDDGAFTSSLGNRRKRFLQSIGRVTAGKLCMSGAAVGASRAALAIAVHYAQHRRISGPRAGEQVPLHAHRTHHSRLLHGLATAYAMTFLHRAVTARWADHAPGERAEVERLVAIAKGWITWQARSLTIEARERCGAHALFSVNGLADYPQYTEGTITAEGDNLVVWVKAASEMLFGHRGGASTDAAAVAARRDLTDTAFLRELLGHAESLWQARARKALRNGPAGDPLGRWNAASSSALRMVEAHARLQAADAFVQAVERAADPSARALLDQLCRLFLLAQLGEYSGDLLAAGHLTAAQVLDLPGVTEETVEALAPRMTALVDAFDLPPEFLASIPLAGASHLDEFNRLIPESDEETVGV
ncbi:acyl-CoA dehydrogenase family protein [Streptomyces pseudogriseolus]|uniref:acyl-CoA dehydrogenase family protein n=1 Tax=Streptomyces pseudogriseolus TaxID=36817 RepID=UPI003FA27A7F